VHHERKSESPNERRDHTEEMQVHAVPDSERAFDSTGRRLPWGIEFAE
jgi:hypothetical protein